VLRHYQQASLEGHGAGSILVLLWVLSYEDYGDRSRRSPPPPLRTDFLSRDLPPLPPRGFGFPGRAHQSFFMFPPARMCSPCSSV